MTTANKETGNLSVDTFDQHAGDFSRDDYDSMLGGESAEPTEEATPDETPENGDPKDETQVQEESELEQPKEERTPEAESDALKKMRIRPGSEKDKAVLALYKSDDFEGTFQDAVDTVYGKRPAEDTKPDETKPESDPYSEIDSQIADLQKQQDDAVKANEAKIKDLREERKRLREEAEDDKADEVIDQINDLLAENRALKTETKMEIKDLERSKVTLKETSQKEAQSAFNEQAAKAKEDAVKEYPFLADKTDENRLQFDAFVNRMSEDPSYQGIFQSPLWPKVMAREFAERNGIAPKTAKQQGEKPTSAERSQNQPAPRRATNTQVLTSGDTPPPESSITEEALVKDLSKMSTKELDALLR